MEKLRLEGVSYKDLLSNEHVLQVYLTAMTA